VRVTHFNLVANILQQSFNFSYFAQKSMKDGSYLRMPGIMQNAVVIGITVQSMMALQSGMQVYMFPKFDFLFLRRCLRKLDLTVLFLVPAIWSRIANECSAAEMAHVRFCMSGASPLPVQVQKKVESKLPPGVHLRVNWGMTETTTAASQPAIFENDSEGSAGRLLPNISALILGEKDQRLNVGEAGELCIKGGACCVSIN
jgi:acyl-CoA synthetase (AMP-forming)/AMP-acid ligase II